MYNRLQQKIYTSIVSYSAQIHSPEMTKDPKLLNHLNLNQ